MKFGFSVFSLVVLAITFALTGCFKISIYTYSTQKTNSEKDEQQPHLEPVLEHPGNQGTPDAASATKDFQSILEHSSLELSDQAVPIKDGFESIYLVGPMIIVQQKDHSIWALSAEKLTTAWKYNLDDKLEFAPTVNAHSAYFVVRGYIHCLSLADGRVRWKTLLPFVPSCAPAASDNDLFIGDYDNNFYGMDVVEGEGGLDRVRVKWKIKMDSYASSRAVITQLGISLRIFVITYRGNLYKFSSEGKQSEDPTSVLGPVVAPLTDYFYGDNRYVLIPSVVGQLNAYHIRHGFAAPKSSEPGGWRYQSKSPLKEAVPVFLDKRVYFRSDPKNDFKIMDLESGKELWSNPDIDRALMLGNRNTYLLTKDKTVVALNRLTLKLANWTLPFDKYDFVLLSPESQKIFAATKTGDIHSYSERQ